MTKINAGKELVTPKAPLGVKYASYCTVTGELPGEHCGEDVSSCWFIADNMPNKECEDPHKTEEELKAEEEAQKTEAKPDEIVIPDEGGNAAVQQPTPVEVDAAPAA